jgi:multidrug efflux pump subunit AcrA (membrane-fusion protein)
VISEEFVYSKDNRYVVYVLSENEEGKAVANEREVKLGLSYQTDVIVEEGLSQGDKLITLGSAFLDDGMRVTVKDNKNLAAN